MPLPNFKANYRGNNELYDSGKDWIYKSMEQNRIKK